MTSSAKPKPKAAKKPATSFERILVPTDFSPDAAQALKFAIPLARLLGGKITLLHVVDLPRFPKEFGPISRDEAQIALVARAALDDLAKRLVPAELLDAVIVKTGRAHAVIVDFARVSRAKMIVIATHGRTGLKRVFLGSTTERVVRHAQCEVVTVHVEKAEKLAAASGPKSVLHLSKILVPMDFSAGSADALRLAVKIALLTKARIALLHVLPPSPRNASKFIAEIQALEAQAKSEAMEKLAKFAGTVPEELKVEIVFRQNKAHHGIIKFAQEWKSDLIVLPMRGHSGINYHVLGSTAEAVVRHSPCPIITLPFPTAKK